MIEYGEVNEETAAANARLIAEAPAMYALLEKVLGNIKVRSRAMSFQGKDLTLEENVFWDEADAVFARIEG